MAEVQQQQEEKTNVIDISRFFGGKTLSSADVKVNKNETKKIKPSFIAAPELASLLDVVATSVEDKNNTIEKVKSVERIREREIVVESTSDSRFERVLSGLRFDIDSISTSYTDLIKSLKNERKYREEENRLTEDLQKQNKTKLSKERVGKSLATYAKPQESLTGEEKEETQQDSGINLSKFIAGTAAAVGLGAGSMFGANDQGEYTGEEVDSGPVPKSNSEAFGSVRAAAQKAGSPAPEVTAAIAMIETGYLQNPNSVYFASNKTNPFGQTGTGSAGYVIGADNQKHAVYKSFDEGVAAHVRLWKPYYKGNSADQILKSLVDAGYNTASPGWRPQTAGIYEQLTKKRRTDPITSTKPGSTQASASSTVAAAPQQTREELSKEESAMNYSPAVASASATKPITSEKITPTETGSQSPPIMISQSPPPRSSGGSYSEGQAIDMSGFSSTNPDNLYLAYALKELNIV